MSTVLSQHGLAQAARRSRVPWALVIAGLACLYLPTYVDLARTLWRDDAYAHGPIVLAVFAWLAWSARDAVLRAEPAPMPALGAPLLAGGLLLYLVGRTQGLPVFEVASHLPVIAGAVLLLAGPRALRALAFPLVFLAFLVPLPGFIMDAVTVPLKHLVSISVETLLNAAGYGIERSGVVLTLDGRDMLVADACSGLNSIFSLFALALLYAHVTRPRSRLRTALLLVSILPIAVVANVVRVATLVLIAHRWGDAAAQGYLHGVAGMVVFVTALGLMIGLDAIVWKRDARHETRGESGARLSNTESDLHHLPLESRVSRPVSPVSRPVLPFLILFLVMSLTAAAVPVLRPVAANTPLDLEAMIPAAFGEWRLQPDLEAVSPSPDVQANLERLYGQIVSRTYVNAAGEAVMLVVAYGGDQSDALKAHRQEACYAAQGFAIEGLEHGTLDSSGRSIAVTRMHAVRGERSEPVTYWFTMGDRVVLGRAERLRVQLENGFQGRIPDGMLVRISNLSGDVRGSYALHRSFAAALLAALPAGAATRFAGAPRS